jgi:hypothetical protein
MTEALNAAPPMIAPLPTDLQARILTLLGAAPLAEDQLIRDLMPTVIENDRSPPPAPPPHPTTNLVLSDW